MKLLSFQPDTEKINIDSGLAFLEIGSANSDIMERKSISVDSHMSLSSTLRYKIENEANIIVTMSKIYQSAFVKSTF